MYALSAKSRTRSQSQGPTNGESYDSFLLISFLGVLKGVGAANPERGLSLDSDSFDDSEDPMGEKIRCRVTTVAKNSDDVPAKSFTTVSITTMTRLHAICQTPTLTEPVGYDER